MSSTAKMPIAMPKSVSTWSTCSGEAPSSTRNCASYMYGNMMRLPTKPGALRTTTPTLERRFANWSAAATTPLPVATPRTISTSRITWAGLKKCRPMTDSGTPETAPSWSMSSVEVLLARMAPGRARRPISPKTSFLIVMFS